MGTTRPLDISLLSLVKWVLPWTLGLVAFGVLPTYMMAGWEGVHGQLVGAGLVLGVMMGIGILTVRAAHAGPARASTVFMGSCFARLAVCPLLLGLLHLTTPLSLAPMAIWMVTMYIATLGLEVVWLIKALRHAVEQETSERQAAKDAESKPEPPAMTQDFSI